MEQSMKERLDAILSAMPSKPKVIMCAEVPYSMFQAMNKFKGRDWRRIKREVNKAEKRAREKQLLAIAR